MTQGRVTCSTGDGVVGTLSARMGRYSSPDPATGKGTPFVTQDIPDIVGALSDGAHMGGGLNGQDAYTGRIIPQQSAPRRLTPRECERLQGFPDDWTLVEHNGKPMSDGQRYRQMGNAVTVSVAQWLGERILAVENGDD